MFLGLAGLIDMKGIDVAQHLYGCEAVQHMLKIKRKKMHFIPALELMLDSITTIKVEPHQCPLHESILQTQGQILEIFGKKY